MTWLAPANSRKVGFYERQKLAKIKVRKKAFETLPIKKQKRIVRKMV